MIRLLLTVSLILAIGAPASALTEQEVIESLVAGVLRAQSGADSEWSVHAARMSAFLRVAGDKRDLNLRIAQKQLLADIAEAAAALAASEAPAAQSRGQFSSAVAQAMGKYQQALGQVHGQWSQEGSAAWSRLTQDSSTTLQAVQQAASSAQQRAQQTLQSPELGEMPPIIDGTLPRVEAPVADADPVAELTQAAAAAREGYLAELDAAFTECDAELEAALALPQGADIPAGLRKAVHKLKINTLDRHDGYEAEVRAAVRRALLAAIE